MENKNLTAVQSFWNKIALNLSVEQINDFLPEFQQAKQMEKEQIKESWIEGGGYSHLSEESDRMLAEQYYKETYNK
jgi:hypothetical protein